MRKENKVMIAYLKGLKIGIEKLIKDMETCPRQDIEDKFTEAIDNPYMSKMAARVQRFMDKLRKCND